MFMEHDSIKTMTIVTNRGKVRTITKNNEFQFKFAARLMKECMQKNNDNIVSSVEEFLPKCYSVGIERQ